MKFSPSTFSRVSPCKVGSVASEMRSCMLASVGLPHAR
eukprot:CAMPEP_0206147524 /NCGR_PEP_ID=MMETSP1473-20131121/33698_1 /ASSEMBLY_ACC=CAM_ASM_001109 /TAXON_ID=1461547 /ORGANISM="Stichococcus sp, Strain RCC1054" /LENGTH=37 /DNA_ID= /DNA_START= /DNA_END= /DNA_ORIENTATION=